MHRGTETVGEYDGLNVEVVGGTDGFIEGLEVGVGTGASVALTIGYNVKVGDDVAADGGERGVAVDRTRWCFLEVHLARLLRELVASVIGIARHRRAQLAQGFYHGRKLSAWRTICGDRRSADMGLSHPAGARCGTVA